MATRETILAEIQTLRSAILRVSHRRASHGSPYSDPGQVLSDADLEAAEAAVRAAIRWTGFSGGPTKVASSFDLIMAELRRLRVRGGDWMELAAEEIARSREPLWQDKAFVLSILQKHRDGKA